jgi:hypothetical protein
MFLTGNSSCSRYFNKQPAKALNLSRERDKTALNQLHQWPYDNNITAFGNYVLIQVVVAASMVQWSEFLTANSEILGSIPGAIKFSV